MISYAFIWLLIIAFVMIMYIILDGFTLGVGLLFPWVRNSKDRDTMISTVLPVWDGNETWLVFAGAAIYAGFPDAFGVLMTALYLPFILLIVGLLFRGVSFEFIHKANKTVHIWEKCFFSGSLMAVVAQGLIVGSYVQGFVVDSQTHDIVVPSIINWFNVFCIFALIVGYSMLGSARLIKKTTGELQDQFFRVSSLLQWVLLASVLFVGVSSSIGIFNSPRLHLNSPQFILMFAIVVVLLMIAHAIAIKNKIENIPFMSLVGIYVISYIGFIISDLPYVVPYQITYLDAKVDDGAFILMLYGAAVLLPLLLFYTAYAYSVFGGKVDEKIHY